jgi:hypothetical protein
MTIDVDAFFNDWNGGGTTSGSTQYANRVYFGVSQPKEVRMKRSGQAITIPAGDETLSITDAKKRYLTDEALRNKWNTALRKNGITADPIQARAIWDLSVDGASDWYATSNGQQKITPYQYLTWYAGGKKAKETPALPTRQVYQVAEEEIAADIDEYLQKKAGRTLQDADKGETWYKDLTKAINNLYSKGIVTTVKEIKNPQTGKMEKVVTQTPGFSKEEIGQKITAAVEAADPASVERKKRIDNTKWLLSQGGQR